MFVTICMSPFIHQNFRREEQNYVAQTEVDSSSVLTSAMSKSSPSGPGPGPGGDPPKLQSTAPRRPDGQRGGPPSLVLAALKRLLPIGMNHYGAREQELVQQAKLRFGQVSGMAHASLCVAL